MTGKSFLNCMLPVALLLAFQAANGQTAPRERGEWEFGAEIYLWGANVDTTSPSGTSSEIRFTDLAENLELGFMVAFGARRDKWSVLADVIYLDVDDNVEAQLKAALPKLDILR